MLTIPLPLSRRRKHFAAWRYQYVRTASERNRHEMVSNFDKLQDTGRPYQATILEPVLAIKIDSPCQRKPADLRVVQIGRDAYAKI